MQILPVVRIIAMVCAGLYAGILLGDRLGASYARARIDASAFVQFQQVQHVHFVRFMPALTIASILAAVIWAFLVRAQWRMPDFWMIVASALVFVACAVLTRMVSVPLNNLMMTWNAASPPANLHELWAPWERVHTIRALLSFAGFVLQAIAVSCAIWRGRPVP
ncbi:MAG: DUF1772 domain-containing protein [Rudaea sp.]